MTTIDLEYQRQVGFVGASERNNAGGEAMKTCIHEWGIDGAHSNEYCKRCFMSKPRSFSLAQIAAVIEKSINKLTFHREIDCYSELYEVKQFLLHVALPEGKVIH